MKIKEKSIVWIGVAVACALAGLLAVQIQLLRRTMILQSRTFDSNVAGVLTQIVQKVETRETLDRIIQVTVQYESADSSDKAVVSLFQNECDTRQRKLAFADQSRLPSNVRLDSNKVILHLKETRNIRLTRYDTDKKKTLVFEKTMGPGLHDIVLDTATQRMKSMVELQVDSSKFPIYLDKSTPGRLIIDPELDRTRRILIDKVLEEYLISDPQSVESRIPFPVLDSLVVSTLTDAGIARPVEYGILNTAVDSLIHAKPDVPKSILNASPYRTRLFPLDIRPEPYELALNFPGRKMALFRQAAGSSAFALMFMAVIAVSFAALIRVLAAQRRFAGHLVEFINNMTHEFQTPISTISVAGETLTKQKIKDDPKRLERFRAVILEETARMRKQVEKILDYAAFEKGDIELRFEPVDLHDLIRQIAENREIQIDKSGGTLALDLKAGNDRILGDAFHLENVLNNLIDNAVKYTHGKPEIRIATENVDGVLRVCVADKGIGIPKDAVKLVFDKYYRVPQGTVHEVKGFGLGLSYVKSVTDKHRGRIAVESEPGKGTIVRLDLPLAVGD